VGEGEAVAPVLLGLGVGDVVEALGVGLGLWAMAMGEAKRTAPSINARPGPATRAMSLEISTYCDGINQDRPKAALWGASRGGIPDLEGNPWNQMAGFVRVA
jgi:hypothetical protein